MTEQCFLFKGEEEGAGAGGSLAQNARFVHKERQQRGDQFR